MCSLHFPPEQIQTNKSRSRLLHNTIPTEFWVECIDVVENHDENTKCEHSCAESHRKKMLRERLNNEIREHKLNDTIKHQSNKIDDLNTKLAQKTAVVDKLLTANKKLKEDLLKSQTSTDIAVNY